MENSEVEFRQLKVKIDKMTNPVLQHISNDNDLSEVTRFFLIFSWFEYALKRADFLPENNEDAKPDWDGFSNRINDDLKSQIEKCPGLKNAVRYLNEHPPGKQIVEKDANGIRSLGSRRSKPRGKEARVLTTYIRRIRNNLFHGGKIPFDPTRDIKLIGSAATILTHFLELDAAHGVKHCYESGGTFWPPNHLKS